MNTTFQSVNIEYFRFEEDFVEDDMRCIPMIVRYKLDACGVKLKLQEWSRFCPTEREVLACMACTTEEETEKYKRYLEGLIWLHTGHAATPLTPIIYAPWEYGKDIPEAVRMRLDEHQIDISFEQWNALRELQRFALVKLSSSDHEHKNFLKALVEFNLV